MYAWLGLVDKKPKSRESKKQFLDSFTAFSQSSVNGTTVAKL